MSRFFGKVAIVTGAASGIGRALAKRCAREGMKVVLADIEKEPLLQTEYELESAGVETLAVVIDVAKECDIQALAEKTLETFGAVHLLFNNAGVRTGSSIVHSTTFDWEWVIGVNLYGVIYGIKTFTPIMMNQPEGGYIVNTASREGLETTPFSGISAMTKHAVISLSETLYHELKLAKAPVGVSVLCPGFVHTRLFSAERNRPMILKNSMKPISIPDQNKFVEEVIRETIEKGMEPDALVDLTFSAIEKEQFYIVPDPDTKLAAQKRMDNILNGHNPTLQIPEAIESCAFFSC